MLLLIFSSITCFVFAQEEDAEVYVSNNPQGSGIAVRWIGANAYYPEGVNIYRSSNGGDWQKLNSEALKHNPTLPEGIELSETAKNFYSIYATQTHKEFTDGFGAIFSVLESVKEFNLALAMNIAYVDETAVFGEKYSYRIEAILKGNTVDLGTTEEIVCGPFTPIPAPDSVVVERKKKYLDVYWSVNEKKHYAYTLFIKRGEAEWAPYEKPVASSALKQNGKPHYRIKASPDTAYVIKVCAHDYFGKEGEDSKEFSMAVQDFTPPVVPTASIEVDSKKMAVKISWSPNTDSDLSHYNIYRTIDPDDFSAPRINKRDIPITDTTYTDYPELAGSYYYIVEAVDLSGNVAKSLFINGTVHDIRPPKNPENLTVRVDTGLLMLSWDANTDIDLKGYRIYRSVSDDNNEDNRYVVAHQGTIDTTYYEEPMPKNVRNPFAFIVRAVDSSLNVSDPSNIVIGQLPDVIPPVAPFIKTSFEQDNHLVIEWMPNVEADLASYNIYKRTKGDTTGFVKMNFSPIPKYLNRYMDKEAVRGQFYEYYIEAVDMSKLVSEKSNTINGRLENLPLSGNIIIDKYRVNAKQEMILRWSLDSLANEPIVGSSIHRSIDGKRAMQIGGVSEKTEIKDKLKTSGTYEYFIRAYGDRGNIVTSDTVKIEIELDK